MKRFRKPINQKNDQVVIDTDMKCHIDININHKKDIKPKYQLKYNKQNKLNKRNIKAYNSKMTHIRNRQYSCNNKAKNYFFDDALIINNEINNRTIGNLEIKNNKNN